MPKPLLQLAAVGVLAFGLWKLASLFFLPLLLTALKVAFVVGLVLLVVWLFRKSDKDKKEDAPPVS